MNAVNNFIYRTDFDRKIAVDDSDEIVNVEQFGIVKRHWVKARLFRHKKSLNQDNVVNHCDAFILTGHRYLIQRIQRMRKEGKLHSFLIKESELLISTNSK